MALFRPVWFAASRVGRETQAWLVAPLIGLLMMMAQSLVTPVSARQAAPSPDDPADPVILAWVADNARGVIANESDLPDGVQPEDISFGRPVRALTWSKALINGESASDDSRSEVALPKLGDNGLWSVDRRGEQGEDERKDTGARQPTSEVEVAVPKGSDPTEAGVTMAIDAWWVPLAVGGDLVGVMRVDLDTTARAAITWNDETVDAVVHRHNEVVQDAIGYLLIERNTVYALDDSAAARIAGPVPINAYLEALLERLASPITPVDEESTTNLPVTYTTLALASLGAVLLFARWSHSDGEGFEA